ncbi:Uncharacterised protein [Bordetella pertussis]|nr:Uncharacterised protein [Bordetella pertussis]
MTPKFLYSMSPGKILAVASWRMASPYSRTATSSSGSLAWRR